MDYQKPTEAGGNGELTQSLLPTLPLGVTPDDVELEEIGARWTEERRSLLLRVPPQKLF